MPACQKGWKNNKLVINHQLSITMQTEQIKAFNNDLNPFIDKMLPELEEIYKDIHKNPELSMQEFRTSKIAADYLTKYQYEVSTGIGVTGVVGLMKNGEGPVVMLRADMDALPVTETTGLAYASTKVARDDEGKEVVCRMFVATICT